MQKLRSSVWRLALAGLLVGLSGCGLWPEKIDETKDWSANRLYSEAKAAINEGNYQAGVGYLEKLQARYPFGRYAQQAQLELMYAYYKDDEPDQAIAAADRFIKTYPRHPYVDYAYYLKGLVNFNRGTGTLDRFLPRDVAKTDTDTARQSYNDFAELVQKLPNSRYAEDARKRMLFLHNKLADYEINVADYYLRRGAYVAAVERADYVLQNYARTPAVADALAIMTKAYVQMDMPDLARDSLRVLKLNYPSSAHIPELTALLEGKGRSSAFSLFGLK